MSNYNAARYVAPNVGSVPYCRHVEVPANPPAFGQTPLNLLYTLPGSAGELLAPAPVPSFNPAPAVPVGPQIAQQPLNGANINPQLVPGQGTLVLNMQSGGAA